MKMMRFLHVRCFIVYVILVSNNIQSLKSYNEVMVFHDGGGTCLRNSVALVVVLSQLRTCNLRYN